MKKYYIIGGALIITGIIIGASLMSVQNNKQRSIEKQAQMKIDQENYVLRLEQEEKEAEETKERTNKLLRDWCIEEAEDAYWSYMELNGTGKRDDEEGVWALTRHWNTAKEDKQIAIDNCYKKYK